MGVWQESLYDPKHCETAVKVLSNGKSICRLAATIGVCRDTIYTWADNHPDFAQAMKVGRTASQAHWEDIGEAGATGELDKFSAPTWIFTMKSRFREDYADRKDEDTSTANTLIEKLIDKL